MIVVFFGNDTDSVRAAARKHCMHVTPAVTPVSIDADTYSEGIVREAADSASLFGEKLLYILDTPSLNTTFNSEVESILELLAQSVHQFVIIEGTLLAPKKRMYEKHAATIEEFKKQSQERFNTFALAEAFARKDKKTLWTLLHDAYRSDITPEEIAGILWWQLKTLRIASHTQSADEAGVKEYPYKKAKRSLIYFKEGELDTYAHTLLVAYHNARRNGLTLDLALERWVLSL